MQVTYFFYLKSVNIVDGIKFKENKLSYCNSSSFLPLPTVIQNHSDDKTFFLLQKNFLFKINITLVANVRYPGSFIFRCAYTNSYALHHFPQRLKGTIYHSKFHKEGKAINRLLYKIRFRKQSTFLLQCTYIHKLTFKLESAKFYLEGLLEMPPFIFLNWLPEVEKIRFPEAFSLHFEQQFLVLWYWHVFMRTDQPYWFTVFVSYGWKHEILITMYPPSFSSIHRNNIDGDLTFFILCSMGLSQRCGPVWRRWTHICMAATYIL